MSRIVWFHPRPLLPARAGGELRVRGLIDASVRAGHEVLVLQPGGESSDHGMWSVRGLPTRRGAALLISKAFSRSPLRTARLAGRRRREVARLIARFDPDLVVVSEVMSWSIAHGLLGETPWIYDAHNVESRLYVQLSDNATTAFDRITFAVDRRRVAAAEAAMLSNADLIVAVSNDDAAELGRLSGRDDIVVAPSSVPAPVDLAPLSQSARVLFVGTLDYPPNVAAVRELVTQILPNVRSRVPGAEAVIVGRRPTKELRRLIQETPAVALHEEVFEVAPFYRSARCVVLPIRSGAGSRLKVYEALAHGVPLVGTAVAVSGVGLPGGTYLRAESPEELADLVVSVLADDDLAGRVAAAGAAHFDEMLSWSAAAEPFVRALEALVRDRG